MTTHREKLQKKRETIAQARRDAREMLAGRVEPLLKAIDEVAGESLAYPDDIDSGDALVACATIAKVVQRKMRE